MKNVDYLKTYFFKLNFIGGDSCLVFPPAEVLYFVYAGKV